MVEFENEKEEGLVMWQELGLNDELESRAIVAACQRGSGACENCQQMWKRSNILNFQKSIAADVTVGKN